MVIAEKWGLCTYLYFFCFVRQLNWYSHFIVEVVLSEPAQQYGNVKIYRTYLQELPVSQTRIE